MLVIDGSFGEGGGQILRSALALSVVTGRPFRMEKVRAGRARPGLLRQHLTAVQAAAAIGRAEVRGDSEGSSELTFAPSAIAPGEYRFSIGTAGSATLVLQTILPALLSAAGPSSITVEGGTHNPMAPPFEHFALALLPLIRRMGKNATAKLLRAGFVPAGGGVIQVEIDPAGDWRPLRLPPCPAPPQLAATVVLAKLAEHIAQRELNTVAERLGILPEDQHVVSPPSYGPGNAIYVTATRSGITDVFTGFGQRGVPAEVVARNAADQVEHYWNSQATVGPQLADQLLLPMALAGGGAMATTEPTLHATTNIEVLRMFLDVDVRVEPIDKRTWEIAVRRPGGAAPSEK
jgi:RNA 3'-terminal phosphate cyclase (ATP)